MQVAKIAGIVLLVVGTLSLVYKGITYTKEKHESKLGPIEFTMKEKDRITIPTWAGVAMVAGGGGLLLWGGRKR